MQPSEVLEKNMLASIEAKQRFLELSDVLEDFDKAVAAIVECYQQGGRLYIAGNGGSAADAQHLAAEFVSKLARDRDPLPAEALTVDSSILTAIGNDYGYDEVFARQIRGKVRKEDMFLGITTSGQSPNILKALDTCREMGILSVIFTGHEGGASKDKADHVIIANGEMTSTIQELHLVLAHTLCECVELAMFQG